MQHPSMLWVVQRTVLLNSVASADHLEGLVSLYLHLALDRYEMFGRRRIEEIVRHGFDDPRGPVLDWAHKHAALGRPRL